MARRGNRRSSKHDRQERSLTAALVGRSFFHPAMDRFPVLDYLLIGGALSLIFFGIVFATQSTLRVNETWSLPYIILFSNSAHFAASTVRLYSKPGASKALPFLTMAFPLVAAAILTLCIIWAERLGPHLQALYLTWSPYHYAAQTYGTGGDV